MKPCIVCGILISDGSRCFKHQHRRRGSTRAWRRIRAAVLQRDNYRCALCGEKASQVDHKIPINDGGTDELSNLRALCRSCNLRKGAM